MANKFPWIYRPGILDVVDPTVIEGRAIARGSRVRDVTRTKGPSAPAGWSSYFRTIEDEHGNVQNVNRRALCRE